jgi:hypothetical protein
MLYQTSDYNTYSKFPPPESILVHHGHDSPWKVATFLRPQGYYE